MKRGSAFALFAATSACAVGLFTAGTAAAASNVVAAPRVTSQMKFLGTVNLKSLAASSNSAATTSQHRAGPAVQAKSRPSAAAIRTANPNPTPTPLKFLTGPPLGFIGITEAEQSAASGGALEPPDQGLCASGNTVMEPVNVAIAIYTESGVTLVPPVFLNSFFGQATGQTAPFLSDPRCYFDKQTGRWFVTVLEIDVTPTGALSDRSHELIAVSQTSDPTDGYALFSIDSTNDGSNGTTPEPNCPCFGDQPRIGADANGFYISADMFPIVDATGGTINSNGGMIWAVSKQGLAAAADGSAPAPQLVAINIGAVTINGNPANAVQPAETPPGSAYPSDKEYFLATSDFEGFATAGGAGANSVVLWTLLNTSSLSSNPALTVADAIVPTEPYTPPVTVAQESGPHPLGESLGDPVAPLNPDDDRMEQVQYRNGHVFSSLSTGVASGSRARTGVAWFDLRTKGSNGNVAHQGYLSTGNGASLLYPSIGLDKSGAGAMTFSVSGPNVFPSAAYIPFAAASGPSAGTITGLSKGALPEDGFTCYAQFGFGPPCRWGDYSAAGSDGNGHIVMGDEMIANTPRDRFANWGTYIATVTP
jgi:hypothetical protein